MKRKVHTNFQQRSKRQKGRRDERNTPYLPVCVGKPWFCLAPHWHLGQWAGSWLTGWRQGTFLSLKPCIFWWSGKENYWHQFAEFYSPRVLKILIFSTDASAVVNSVCLSVVSSLLKDISLMWIFHNCWYM